MNNSKQFDGSAKQGLYSSLICFVISNKKRLNQWYCKLSGHRNNENRETAIKLL